MALLVMSATSLRAGTVTLSTPEDVEDAPLVDGEFAGWNFGASPLLEAGYMGGIYTEHHAASLLRFDLRAAPLATVTRATLRLYKPKDFIQARPLNVLVYAVAPSSAKWKEGTNIFSTSGVKAADKIAHDPRPLAAARAPDRESAWLEFPLPPALVQRWLDDPASNAGLLVALDPRDERQWGDHVYFHASEHYLGRTPQLVLEGTPGSPHLTARKPPKARLLSLPSEDTLDPWLKRNGRLAKFAKDLHCSPDQARLFQLFDTTVRDQLIVARYQAPFHDVTAEIPSLIGRHDEKAIRDRLAMLHELLLKWEYIRETAWYTSGPLADSLSPRQLNRFFAADIFGTMESAAEAKSKEIWRVVPPAKMAAHNRATMADLADRLHLIRAQVAYLAPRIAELETQENHYLALFRDDLARCQQLLKRDADGPDVFAAVRDLHLHHERFLYFQSIYNTPRWMLITQHAPIEPFAAWVAGARKDHYDRAVRGAAQREKSTEPEN